MLNVCPRCQRISPETVTHGRYVFCASCVDGWEFTFHAHVADMDPELVAGRHIPPLGTVELATDLPVRPKPPEMDAPLESEPERSAAPKKSSFKDRV